MKIKSTIIVIIFGTGFATALCFLLSFLPSCSFLQNVPISDATCTDVCNHARELGCEMAKGAPGEDLVYGTGDIGEVACEVVCGRLFGADSFYDLNCLAKAVVCGDMDRCAE